MTDDMVKLTCYFGERHRAGNRFLAEALPELYADAAVAVSVVLRGIASFGPRHQLRTDRSLSLSEDPPIVVIAVDTAQKMADLARQAVAMTANGLVTLERVRPAHRFDATTAATVTLTVYVGRYDRAARQPAHRAACDILHRHGFASATAFLGVDGTRRGRRQQARFFGRNRHVPVMITATGDASQVDDAMSALRTALDDPLMTVERAQLCKRDGRLLDRPTALPSTDDRGLPLWQKLTIRTSEATLYDGAPIHRALVRRLHESAAVSGATALRGIWGFHGDHKPHGDRLIQLVRRVPVSTVIVDTPERIAACFDVVDEVTAAQGLVTSELVPAMVSIEDNERRGGTRLARHGP
ncbi:DUF190 domain-containing protein [Mycolicibacterium pulveris]|uniref:DUF190 domain-containing protein n=1 Tax=Mycolicibacterium pulveris TaxID=36813 RepID=UPI0015D24052|nr:DUF190 domain-containing protein [Mycolicibacterium pulveris]MCV6981513.1 DUF190 domain-containing protein [Mycolicibacterium pulveris]